MDQIGRLTYPQILMMNHAAAFNKEQMDARIEERRQQGELTGADRIADEPLVDGKKLTDLTSDEYMQYLGTHVKPKVIKTKPS